MSDHDFRIARQLANDANALQDELICLRAEVKRRGEMLRDCLDHLHVAKTHYGSFSPIRSKNEVNCDGLIELIEALTDEN